jgi:hypothetical protein
MKMEEPLPNASRIGQVLYGNKTRSVARLFVRAWSKFDFTLESIGIPRKSAAYSTYATGPSACGILFRPR